MANPPQERTRPTDDIQLAILSLDPSVHDLHIVKSLRDQLLRIKDEVGELDLGRQDGFVYCSLCIQIASREISDLRFRVKLFWTGIEVKNEIRRLYEIPIKYQVLIINSHVISDRETLENCEFRERDQIVYIILTKKRTRCRNSGIRLREFIPERNADLAMEGGSDSLVASKSLDHETALVCGASATTSQFRDESELSRDGQEMEVDCDESKSNEPRGLVNEPSSVASTSGTSQTKGISKRGKKKKKGRNRKK